MFACEHEGVEPDLMVLGKGITGGYLPLAATLATEDIYRAFLGTFEEGRTFYHGHSYTANPLACAAALASLELFGRERTLERIEARISQLANGLSELHSHPHVGDIRQCGLIAGIELVADRQSRTRFPPTARVGTRVAREARQRGAILRPLGDTLVVMPPLSIRPDELDALLSALFESLAAVSLDLAEA
jgi:adenosylmethionine-8-amino-7-oxononanoate aminotransferase